MIRYAAKLERMTFGFERSITQSAPIKGRFYDSYTLGIIDPMAQDTPL